MGHKGGGAGGTSNILICSHLGAILCRKWVTNHFKQTSIDDIRVVTKLVKEFDVQGRICNLPPEMTEEEFWHKVIGFIEENGWSFGGGLELEKISGCVSAIPPDMTIEEFEETFLGFVKRNGWLFEGSITIYGYTEEGAN